MSKTVRANYIAVLEALKAHDCITGYTIKGHDVTPEWKDGGANRALQELTNPKPFGLKKSQKACLLLVLPQKEQDKISADFLRAVNEQYSPCD